MACHGFSVTRNGGLLSPQSVEICKLSLGVYLGLNSHGVSQCSVTMARNQDGTRLLSSHQHSSSLNTLQSALLIFFTLLSIQPETRREVLLMSCVSVVF